MKNAALLAVSLCGLCMFNACGGEITNSTPPPSALAITSSVPPAGDVQAAYGTSGNGFPLTASGGKTPYAWNWVAADGSSLPNGLNVSNGSIVGTPMVAGDYDVVVTVTDSESPAIQTSATYTIAITGPLPSLTITSGNPPMEPQVWIMDQAAHTNVGQVRSLGGTRPVVPVRAPRDAVRSRAAKVFFRLHAQEQSLSVSHSQQPEESRLITGLLPDYHQT